MPKTINGYSPDNGEVTLTVSSADASAMSELTTAEAITLDGVVRKFEETTPKTRQYDQTYVTGDAAPILTISDKEAVTVWTLTIVDDYSEGLAGEWGTDNLSGVELIEAYFNNKRTITVLTCTPAGGATGDIETTLTNVEVQTMPTPMIDADATKVNEVTYTFIAEDHSRAAHS